jgi:hypothetical protein
VANAEDAERGRSATRMLIRPARWPGDLPLLRGLDTPFVTERVYRVKGGDAGFTVVEERIGTST